MTLRDMMQRHGRRLHRLDHHGELVTYTPRGGEPVQVQAVVDRLGRLPADQTSDVAYDAARVSIPNDADVGVTSVGLGDTVTLALQLGRTEQECRVSRIISQDEGAFLIEVHA